MIYRKLRPDDATHDGDMYASPCVGMAGKLAKQVVSVSGCSEILRPISDEPEDVERVEGKVSGAHDYPQRQECRLIVDIAGASGLDYLVGNRVTLLIPRPEPPMPKCPYCGQTLVVREYDNKYRCSCENTITCKVSVQGPYRPTRREAIEAMTPKGGGQ